LIIVPDDALIEGEPAAHEADQKSPVLKTDESSSRTWEERASAESTRRSIWTRRTETPAQIRPETSAEPLRTETARASEAGRPPIFDDEKAPEIATPVTTDEAVTTVPRDEAVRTVQQDQPLK